VRLFYYRRGSIKLTVMVLGALLIACASSAMDSQPEVAGPVRLVEVGVGEVEASAGLGDLLAEGSLRVAARTGESTIFYATQGGIAGLEAEGAEIRLLLDDVGDSEIYLIPALEGFDIGSLKGKHRILGITGSHYLVAADPAATMEIHLLPFKKKLPGIGDWGLPLESPRPARLRGASEPLIYDPAIQAMVDSVSQSSLYSTLNGLSGETQVLVGGEPYTIDTRYSPTAMCKVAGQFILETFQAMGLETEYDYFN